MKSVRVTVRIGLAVGRPGQIDERRQKFLSSLGVAARSARRDAFHNVKWSSRCIAQLHNRQSDECPIAFAVHVSLPSKPCFDIFAGWALQVSWFLATR